jgi:hypothetical protein
LLATAIIWRLGFKQQFPVIAMKIFKLAHGAALFGAAFSLIVSANSATAQTTNSAPAPSERPKRPTPPARDPNTPGYVTAKELPDG